MSARNQDINHQLDLNKHFCQQYVYVADREGKKDIDI